MNTKNVPKTHKVRKEIAAVVMNVILIIFSLSCIFPIVWMAYSSLKEKRVFNADIMGLPKNPTLINYIKILSNKDYHLGESMMNSVRTTGLSIILIILFSFIVGYILARVHFKLNRVLYVMFLMGMLIPIHSLLVPIYVVFQKCGINNRWFTLLLPYVSFGLPTGIFLVEGYVKTIPVSLEEASKVAGFSRCHFSKLFRAYTGLSFTDFVTRERLHIAENLLKKPDLTITEVSLESGFNSISTFNRVFLKSKNVSPTDFRQMYLQSYQK